jgi:predicted RNA-binding protein with PUA-like domain
MARKYWLMKSEPSEFSIDDLQKSGQYFWDGVRNYQVRNMFRDDMKVGDVALFYHSSCTEVGVVGEMEILKVAKADPTQFDSKSKYFDVKSTKDNPRWLGPVVGFKKKYQRMVSLTEIKTNPFFNNLPLVKKGNRLSAFPISKVHYVEISRLAKIK